jgi:hypothetical protein
LDASTTLKQSPLGNGRENVTDPTMEPRGSEKQQQEEPLTSLMSRLIDDLAAARERAVKAETANEILRKRIASLRYDLWKLRDEVTRLSPDHDLSFVDSMENDQWDDEVAMPVAPEPPKAVDGPSAPPPSRDQDMAEEVASAAPPPPDLWAPDVVENESEEDASEKNDKKWWRRKATPS